MIYEAYNQGVIDGHPMGVVRKSNEIRDYVGFDGFMERWTKDLRSEAWHPIEMAEELGAKDGRTLLLSWDSQGEYRFATASWNDQFGVWVFPGWMIGNPEMEFTHFRFINPPEGA